MTTIIISNGGGSQLPISALFDRLTSDPLDRAFEAFGNFVLEEPENEAGEPIAPPGTVRFWGNFATYSHVFSIDTDEPELIERLTTAIRANQEREDYLDQPPCFDTRQLEIRKHVQSQTQWEIELIYEGRSLGRFGDKIALNNRGQWEGHPLRIWQDLARAILRQQHAGRRAEEKRSPSDPLAA